MDINRIVSPKEKRNFINETLKEVNNTNFVKDFEKIIQENIKLNKTMAYFAVDYDKEKQQKYLNEAEKSEKVEKSIADETIPTILDEDTGQKIIDPKLVKEYEDKNINLTQELELEYQAMINENEIYQEYKKLEKDINNYDDLNKMCVPYHAISDPKEFNSELKEFPFYDERIIEKMSYKRFENNYPNAMKTMEKMVKEFNKIENMTEKEYKEYQKKHQQNKGAER